MSEEKTLEQRVAELERRVKELEAKLEELQKNESDAHERLRQFAKRVS